MVVRQLRERFEIVVDLQNAFILPGGQVILTSGLVRESGTADEMAAAVAFLLAHGLAGHATEQTLRHAGLGLVLLLAGDRSTDAAEISTNPLPALTDGQWASLRAICG